MLICYHDFKRKHKPVPNIPDGLGADAVYFSHNYAPLKAWGSRQIFLIFGFCLDKENFQG